MRIFFSLLAFASLTGLATAQCFSVTTTTVAGNGQNGTMFDIVNTSTSAITIGSFDQCFLNANPVVTFQIYTKPGTWNGSEANPAAWTLVGSTTNLAHGIAPALDPLPITVNVTIAPGATQGFYLTGDTGTTVAYTTGVNQLGTVIGSDASLQVTAGVGKSYPFGTTFGLPTAGRLWNGRVNYCPATGGTVLATNTSLGAGCLASYASFYENFATSAAFDLANSSMSLLFNGAGYVALPGITTYVPPSTSATSLVLSDDSQTTVALTSPFPYVGGTTTAMSVCSNGYVSVNAAGNGTAFTPAVAAFLNAANTGWWMWHDYNPAIAGSGQVKFEEIGGIAYITWDGVYSYATTVPDTFQMQFDTANGNVHIVWGAMSLAGNGFLVGYSPGGVSADPGNRDLSATLPATFTIDPSDILPLTLAATSRPVTNTSWNLTTSNIPTTGVLGVDIYGVSDPGINDLFFLGAPGCGLRASLDVMNAWLSAGTTHTYSLPIPNSPALLNFNLYTTSAVFQAPPVNAFGAITSNGIQGMIGDF
ncbi:MAG: hypothetical protein FJ301_11400 [Planctomycetes bacterium]|nr:hypothetical protein [Planctomycetota bacterium]